MKRHLILAIAAASGLVTASALAQSRAPVTGSLDVRKVSMSAQGVEQYEAAEAARPADVLEYTAKYRNDDRTVARSLAVTLPIPPGTELLAGSVRPATGVMASLDGVKFRPAPLMHKVRRADGSSADVPVPYTEYRFLRWPAADLGAGAEAMFQARARVATTPAVRTP